MLKDLSKYDPKVIGWGMHALGAILCFSFITLVWSMVLNPLKQEINQSRRMSQAVTGFLKNSVEIKQQNKQLTDELKLARQEWESTLAQIPVTAQESAYLAELTQQVQASNLTLNDFNLGASHHHETIKERDLNVTLTGDYVGLCHFLNEIDDLSRITNVQQLRVTPPSPNYPDEKYQINLNLRMAYAYQEQESL